VPGLWGAIAAFLLIQCQILLDCSDGELARWRKQSSVAGIYLDRFAHYFTESLLPIALGIRADGGWDSIGGYTTLGCVAAVLALLVRVETALVIVARAEAGLPVAEDTAAVAAPRASGSRGCGGWSRSSRSSAPSWRSRRRSWRWRRRSPTRSRTASRSPRAW
jgi:phosphatidylglycerophosphate synthase